MTKAISSTKDDCLLEQNQINTYFEFIGCLGTFQGDGSATVLLHRFHLLPLSILKPAIWLEMAHSACFCNPTLGETVSIFLLNMVGTHTMFSRVNQMEEMLKSA